MVDPSSLYDETMDNYRIIFIVLLGVLSGKKAVETTLKFVVHSDIPGNRYVTDNRLTHMSSVSTTSHCAVECQQLSTCLMFSYTPSTQLCQMYYDLITEQSAYTTYSIDTEYYGVSCSDSTDYLYYRTYDLCLHRHTQQRNFTEARDACWQEGGTLFEPKTVDLVYFFNKYHQQRFWVGGYGDKVNEGWFWFTGGEIGNATGIWLPGNPGADPSEKPCVEVRPQSNNVAVYGLNDRNCSYIRSYYCQTV